MAARDITSCLHSTLQLTITGNSKDDLWPDWALWINVKMLLYMWIVIGAIPWQILRPRLYITLIVTHYRYHPSSPKLLIMCLSTCMSLTHITVMPSVSLSRCTLWLPSAVPHLPPIWPLEQTRWVGGRVTHSSLRVAEVLVVAAESVGWFGQAEGAQRPGTGWRSPKKRNFSGARLSVSHLGFQMKGLLERQAASGRLLEVLLQFCLQQLCSQSTKRQLRAGDTSGCPAIAVSAMLWLALVWSVTNPVEHNAPESLGKWHFPERESLHLNTGRVFVSGRQSKRSYFWVYLKGAMPISMLH